VTTWLPITTAPKDRTKVDLWFPYTGRQTDCYFDADPFYGVGQWVWDSEDGIGCFPNQEPLYWAPIPADPEPRLTDPLVEEHHRRWFS